MMLVQELIEENSTKLSEASAYPVFGCICGSEKSIICEGMMDYEQVSTDTYRMKQLNCPGCGYGNNTAYMYLPVEFQIRLHVDLSIKTGSFCKRVLPSFRDYVSTAAIQYNPTTRHFRTLKFTRNDCVIVLDGPTYREEMGTGRK